MKREDHYVRDDDFEISPSATKIHSITHDFLQEHGQHRKQVMSRLQQDLLQYQPLVVGHFMKFDFHVVGAEFFRAGLDNPLEKLPTFCTMVGTAHLARGPRVNYLRLGELYSFLFEKPLENQHNALVDAAATAACFFELEKRNHLSEASILQQQTENTSTGGGGAGKKSGNKILLLLLFLFLLVMLIFYWI